jgi:hypothetical protein
MRFTPRHGGLIRGYGHVNCELIFVNVGLVLMGKHHPLVRGFSFLASRSPKPTFAKGLFESTAFDTVPEPPLNCVVELMLRVIGRRTLRHNIELRADRDPTIVGVSTDECPELNCEFNRLAHLKKPPHAIAAFGRVPDDFERPAQGRVEKRRKLRIVVKLR